MTRERRYHIVAISLMAAAIVVGALCWVLDGTAFWVVCGIAVLLMLVGFYFASRASAEERKRQEQGR